MGTIKDPRAVEPLIAASKDQDGYVRDNAAVALGNIDAELLIAALKDQDHNVRERAATALIRIKDLRAVEPLIAALKDQDIDVRKSAAVALADNYLNSINPRPARALLAAMKEDDPAMVEMLSYHYNFFIEWGEPGTENVLITALNARGEKLMAEAFLNCGNERLKTAADAWVARNHYQIFRYPSGGGVQWGSGH